MLASVFGALRSNTPPPDNSSVLAPPGSAVMLSGEFSAPSVAMKRSWPWVASIVVGIGVSV
jgi:hypothetical protein